MKLNKKIDIIKRRFGKFYPYEQCSPWLKIRVVLRTIVVKIFNRLVYRDISLLKYMKKMYGLKNNREFLAGYYKSKYGFDELWESKSRNTKESVESFYNEQDSDVWRQVYLSEYDREKKNYVLRVYNLINYLFKNRNTKILDYGCGCGVFSQYLYSKGYKNITLADIKSSTFKFIKNAFEQRFKYLEINNNTSLKESYDVILLIDVLAHAFDPQEIAAHIIDHLKRGGLLIHFFEKGIHHTHLARAINQREKVMDYIYDKCTCLKEDEVFIKK